MLTTDNIASYGGAMFLAALVTTLLLVLLFAPTGAAKVVSLPQSVSIRDHLAVPPPLWRSIGVLELAAAVGLLVGLTVPALAILAAGGLALLSIGAIGSHLRAQDGVMHSLPAGAGLILAVGLIAVVIG
jgi:uncharacterized membrane protein YphA (DoxX/SURF4 family)